MFKSLCFVLFMVINVGLCVYATSDRPEKISEASIASLASALQDLGYSPVIPGSSDDGLSTQKK